MDKTGYSRRILTSAIKSLEVKGLIAITGSKGQSLECTRSRRGSWLYFNYQNVHFPVQRSAILGCEEVHSSAHNKTNKTKLNETKGSERSRAFPVSEVIAKMEILSD